MDSYKGIESAYLFLHDPGNNNPSLFDSSLIPVELGRAQSAL
jgi:hypothetical protein